MDQRGRVDQLDDGTDAGVHVAHALGRHGPAREHDQRRAQALAAEAAHVLDEALHVRRAGAGDRHQRRVHALHVAGDRGQQVCQPGARGCGGVGAIHV